MRFPDAWRRALGVIALLALLVVPRVVDLSADAWPDLCWGSGIWTDEGFYTHNARNAVLFGAPEQDDFNNRILSPVLDAVQRAVFAVWGVGLVPARAISALSGLLSLVFFWDALRRRFGSRVACFGLLLLGAEASFVFTNRLALMESPAVLLVCVAFWAWCVGGTVGVFVSGAAAMGAIAVKSNFLLFLPLPAVAALWRWRRGEAGAWRELVPYGLGAAAMLGVYIAAWGAAHGPEIVRMNDFYRRRQSQPRSFEQALWMVRRGLVGYHFGMLQRLETRTPVLTTLGLIGLALWPRLRPSARPRPRRAAALLLWLWLLAGFAFLLVSRYAPARYYLVFTPALAGVAALTLDRLPALWRLSRRTRRARRLLAWSAFPFGFHLVQPLLMAAKPVGQTWAVPAGLLAGALGVWGAWRGLGVPSTPPAPDRLRALVLSAFLAGGIGQMGTWWVTRRHDTRAASARLSRLVGPSGVLVGDWAPNLCLENRLRAVPVFRDLANDHDPVGRFRADAVIVAQTPVPVAFWKELAPEITREANRIDTLRYHGYRLNVYRVPERLRAPGGPR